MLRGNVRSYIIAPLSSIVDERYTVRMPTPSATALVLARQHSSAPTARMCQLPNHLQLPCHPQLERHLLQKSCQRHEQLVDGCAGVLRVGSPARGLA